MRTKTVDEIQVIALWGTSADNGSTGRVNTDNSRINWQQIIGSIGNQLQQVDEQEQARLRHRLGYIALLTGDVRNKAVEAFTMVHDSAIALQDKQLEAMANNGLSATYDLLGQRHQSLRHAQEAARLATEIGNQRLLALALNYEAQFYKENGQNKRANTLFQMIEEIGQGLNDEELIMAGHIGLGRTTRMADAETAIAHYQQAIEIATARNDEPSLAICYNNLSDWKIYAGQYEEAIALRLKSLSLSEKIGSREGIARAQIGMAKAYTLLGNHSKARELLNKGLPMALRVGDVEGDLHASLNLAYLYVKDGDIPRACELYRQVLERSLAAPDHACALFAQKALELLADDQTPTPGILPDGDELTIDELESVVGGVAGYTFTYPTGDRAWGGFGG